MKIPAILLLNTFLIGSLFAQKTEVSFEVSFKGKKIGVIKAIEEKTGQKSIKNFKTETDTNILVLSVHVESEVKVVTENGILVEGTTYRHANRGAEDVHAHVKKIASKTYQRERNGQTQKSKKKTSPCVWLTCILKSPKELLLFFQTCMLKNWN